MGIRFATAKTWASVILFTLLAFFIELLVVLYAIKLGVHEAPNNILKLNFQMPGTQWTAVILISPLFHLVPMAVVIALVSIWAYLTKVIKRSREPSKGKVKFHAKGEGEVKELFGKIKLALYREPVKGGLYVLLVFSALILAVSLLTYPQLIYGIVAYAYQNDPSLRNFVKGAAETLAPISGILSPVHNALLSIAPIFREFYTYLGNLIKPLAELDDAGKYLFFQNAAAWVSALAALFYGEYILKGRRYIKSRKG